MRALLVSSTLLLTIATAMAFGVGLGYSLIVGVLHLFGYRQQSAARRTAPALVAAETAGD